MKKALTFLFVLLIITLSYGQQNFDPEQDSPLPKNELKLNMLELLVMPAIGITYERFINDHSSYGIYGFVSFDTDTGYRYEKFELAPFYRIYLQSKKNASNKGFYAELFAGINGGEAEFYDYYDRPIFDRGSLISQEYIGVSLGLDLGYKFVNYNNYSVEVFAGAGRFLNEQYIDAYPRVGVSIGKRF